jgi:uncharacterized membrane protein YcaP (DUF421 family)
MYILKYMCIFNEYRHIFGKEKKGIHSYRLFNFAIMDIIFTIIGSIILTYFLKINVFILFIILILLGILLHYLFCVETTLNLYLYTLFK